MEKFIAWLKSLFAPKAPAPAVEEPHPVYSSVELPWRQWFVDRLGWNESNPANVKELEKGWKYTNVPEYRGIAGAERAWCAMSLCTALEVNGFKSSKDAAAASYDKYGTAIDWKTNGIPKGAIVTIRHNSGGRHVTTANRDHKVGEKVLEALGGNQSNSINVTTYSLEAGHDSIVAVRWPVKKDGSTVKPTTPSGSIILPWEAKDSSRATWTGQVLAKLDQHFAIFDSAKDAHDYHPNYSALTTEQKKHVWANMICAIAKFESAWKVADQMTESNGAISQGLFQLTYGDSFCPKKKSEGDLNEPLLNIRCAIDIMASLIRSDGIIASGGYTKYGAPAARGIARYWSVIRIPDSKSSHHKAEIQAASRVI